MTVKNQNQIDVLVELGRSYFAQGRMQDAKDCFLHVIALDADHSMALNAYATTLCELNNGEWTDEAADVHSQPLRANPRNVKAWNNIGDYHYRRGEFDQALEYFEKATAIDPSYVTPYVNAGLCYRNTNRSEDALIALRKALILDPRSGWARFQYAL